MSCLGASMSVAIERNNCARCWGLTPAGVRDGAAVGRERHGAFVSRGARYIGVCALDGAGGAGPGFGCASPAGHVRGGVDNLLLRPCWRASGQAFGAGGGCAALAPPSAAAARTTWAA